MPITPAAPYPKAPGQTIRSTDWNQAVDEIVRLDNAKVNRAGDTLTGSLTINGALGVGQASPASGVAVASSLAVGPLTAGSAVGRLEVSGALAELGFIRRSLAAPYPASPAAGDRYVWYNSDGTARLFTDVSGNVLHVGPTGNVQLTGPLSIPKSGGGFGTFSNFTFSNEGTFQPGNLKLVLGALGFTTPGSPPMTYEFVIGHSAISFINNTFGTQFVKRFGINHNGDLFCGGSKAGYVVDYFVNAVGETVEQGDVVVIAANPEMRFYGARGDIPVPEIDLTDRPYDTRVCGVVAQFVSEADLPMVDPPELREGDTAPRDSTDHPFQAMAATGANADPRKVGDRQLGRMATLGAYAHCKVDADVAPIEAGDLLTTSSTRGHAQKVTDTSQAVGCIIGKALASLRVGKGKIPVLVMLQ
jgi:hypothetical protein